MHWEYLIPIVVLGVYILSSLLRNQEEEKRADRQRQGADPDRMAQPRAAQRSGNDIDRFLDEVNRRRRQAAERAPAAPQRPTRSIPTARPVPASRSPRPAQQPPPARPPAPPRRPPVELVPQPREAPPVAEVVEVLPVLEPLEPQPAPTPPPAEPSFPATAPRSAVPERNLLVSLLQSREGLRTALLLKIILDPPSCKRRQGRP